MTFFYAAAGGLDHRAAAYLFRGAGGGRGASVPPRPAWAAHLFLSPSRSAGRGPARRVCSPRREPDAAYLFRPAGAGGAAHLFPLSPSGPSSRGAGISVPPARALEAAYFVPCGRNGARRICSLLPLRGPWPRSKAAHPFLSPGNRYGAPVPRACAERRRICSPSPSRPMADIESAVPVPLAGCLMRHICSLLSIRLVGLGSTQRPFSRSAAWHICSSSRRRRRNCPLLDRN